MKKSQPLGGEDFVATFGRFVEVLVVLTAREGWVREDDLDPRSFVVAIREDVVFLDAEDSGGIFVGGVT